MKAFRVFLNGEPICTAGIGHSGVLTAIVSWAGRISDPADGDDFHFHLGGLDTRTDEHVGWTVPELKVGDEVSVLIVETEEVDPEQHRYRAEREEPKESEGKAS